MEEEAKHEELQEEEPPQKEKKTKEEKPPKKRVVQKLVIPRREPSVVEVKRKIRFRTPDKTTCRKCTCFPKESPYEKPPKLNPCQKSPLTLYELAAMAVDEIPFPEAFMWDVEDVVKWFKNEICMGQYVECIRDNYINGMRLIMFEDPSRLPLINIRNFEHIQWITRCIRHLFHLEWIRWSRSIGLPPRVPLTHCTWFFSRNGPNWGVRKNWTRSDVLRWMKILNPEPIYRDHWDLVWYRRPLFPRTKFGRVPNRHTSIKFPMYEPPEPAPCKEYLAPRKFRLQRGIPNEQQFIWMEHRKWSIEEIHRKLEEETKAKIKTNFTKPKDTRLVPKKIKLDGLKGKDLLLARRKKDKAKFFVDCPPKDRKKLG